MSVAAEHLAGQPGPWNPGIKSSIPRRLLPLSTLFRPENVFTSVERASELRDLTGLELSELVVFRPERLVLHEVLIRVTCDLSVPDGSRYEDLGINFRRMVGVILAQCVLPRMSEVRNAYDAVRRRLAAIVEAELALATPQPRGEDAAAKPRARRFPWPRRRSPAAPVPVAAPQPSLSQAADAWEARAMAGGDALEKAARLALARVARALYHRNTHASAFVGLLGTIAVDLASNSCCSEAIGCLIEPYMLEAAVAAGYRLLPSQQHPVVLNTKGPSASGKSTLRPLQRLFAGRIGVRWDEFALISPDIWRKQLLDYASLGADHRYGAMLTGDEIAIIDQKLDGYMASQAERGRVPHLLIDRFRFGSFSPESERVVSKLLSRFGRRIYFCFMITPPQDIVERAWTRGLQHGRYKAVDDLLAHSVEAYSGMPRLFLAWAQRVDKQVHYEFLDNSVPYGCLPRTVAFGSNGALVVLDVKAMLDVGRFRGININATAPQQLYDAADGGRPAPESCADFLVQCVRQLREVVFAEQSSGRIVVHFIGGQLAWADPEALRRALSNPQVAVGLHAVSPDIAAASQAPAQQPRHLKNMPGQDQADTLGDWGGAPQAQAADAIVENPFSARIKIAKS